MSGEGTRRLAVEGEGCLPPPMESVFVFLAVIDGAVAIVALVQLLRIHLRNQQIGWTRQKVFHLLIGLSNLGFILYFVSALEATCGQWFCWTHGCGFALLASPQILFFAVFLLLLSFWVDLCHQTNEEDDDEDEHSYNEAFLDKTLNKPGAQLDGHRRCCSFQGIHVGSRQKIVFWVITVMYVIMFASAILIWVGRGENHINPSAIKKAYLAIISVAVLLLGGTLAFYGLLLFLKMNKVRSETISAEKWKVASLAVVSLVCFTTSAMLALITNVPVLISWYSSHSNISRGASILFIYYVIGSSVPSCLVLWVMREMPPRQVADRSVRQRVVTLLRNPATAPENPLWRNAVTSSNKATKSSPI